MTMFVADGPDAKSWVEIYHLVQQERRARDFQMWTEMGECYHPDAEIEISWFKGTSAEFVAASERIAAAGTRSIHQMSPSIIRICGDRALSDTGCEIHILTVLESVEMVVSSQARLLSRIERREGRWKLSGFRTLYVWDTLSPVGPGACPALDEAELRSLRPSYRHLAYVMSRLGHPFPSTLAGVDRPGTEQALRAKEEAWLLAGSQT